MKKLLLGTVLLLSGCLADSQDTVLEREKVELPDTQHSKTTKAYQITYLSDGLEVSGYMVTPKKVEKDLPLLIYNRGGNQEYGKINKKFLSRYLSFWANKGYIVLASQYRGNDGGEGKEEFGGSDVNDVLNLVKAAGELPDVNMDNKVMLGRSRGGMMTYLAIKEEVDIKAAAVVGGVTDLFNLYSERNSGMKRVLIELVGTPAENEEAYKSRSAVYWPDQLDVPLLIMHGENDWRVPVEQARELSGKLSERDVPFKYVEYEGGDHQLTDHVKESSEEAHQWFQEHIE